METSKRALEARIGTYFMENASAGDWISKLQKHVKDFLNLQHFHCVGFEDHLVMIYLEY